MFRVLLGCLRYATGKPGAVKFNPSGTQLYGTLLRDARQLVED